MHVSYLDNRTLSMVAIGHTHDYFEFFLLYEGKMSHLINGEEKCVDEGSLLFIRPEDVHGFINLEGKIRGINIILDGSLLKRLTESLGGEEIMNFISNDGKHLFLEAEIVHCLTDATQSFSMFPGEDTEKLLLLALGQAILVSKLGRIRPQMPAWLDEVVKKYRYPARFTLPPQCLYELCGCTREHACRSFKRYLGVTPTQFLNDLRLAHAHYLLSTTNKSVTEVSLLCGFESISHFNHLFKKRYGVSPSRCRRA